MKLLLDENLSRKLVPFLQDRFPGTSHVVLAGLERADDLTIWRHAREEGYALVTRDADYLELSALRGTPPLIVWIKMHNPGKGRALQRLLQHAETIEQAQDSGIGCVEIA